jgi:uncharacterized protein
MFSLPSFPKLFLIVAVIAAVWWWFRRPAEQSPTRSEGQSRNGAKAKAGAGATAKQKAIEDLVKCPRCGTYIAAGSGCSCDKAGTR